MLADPTPTRVSACPVHFIWDGRGRGRVLVRAGFLGFLVAGALRSASMFGGGDGLRLVALGVFAGALVTWVAGQVASVVTKLRHARRA